MGRPIRPPKPRPARDLLVAGSLAFTLAACALFKSASAVAPADDASKLRSALMIAYRYELKQAIDTAPSCPAALVAVRAKEAEYTDAWQKLGVPPEPPMTLTCPDGGAP